MLGTQYPCSRAVSRAVNTASAHGRHFWTPVNTVHRDRQTLLLMTSFSTRRTGVQNDTRVHGASQMIPVNTAREHVCSVYRALEMSISHIIKPYTNVLLTYLLTYLLIYLLVYLLCERSGVCQGRHGGQHDAQVGTLRRLTGCPPRLDHTQLGDVIKSCSRRRRRRQVTVTSLVDEFPASPSPPPPPLPSFICMHNGGLRAVHCVYLRPLNSSVLVTLAALLPPPYGKFVGLYLRM